MENSKWIGFDLGGTKMLAAILDNDSKILGSAKTKTASNLTSDELLKDIVDTIHLALDDANSQMSEIKGMGMGFPGPVDRQGMVIAAPNLGLKEFPLAAILSKKLGFPVLVENDVNAGTYAEYKFGAARKFSHIVGVFPGTGVGGAVISDGILLRGARGCGAELGHMIIQLDGPLCGCGQYGDLEALCSRSALAKDAASLAATGKSQIVFEKAGTDFRKVKSSVIKRALDAKEPEMEKLVNRSAQMLGVGLGNLATIFDPEIFILGGGVVEKLGKQYINEVRKSMIKHTMNPFAAKISVVEAELGDDAVFKGALALLKDQIGA